MKRLNIIILILSFALLFGCSSEKVVSAINTTHATSTALSEQAVSQTQKSTQSNVPGENEMEFRVNWSAPIDSGNSCVLKNYILSLSYNNDEVINKLALPKGDDTNGVYISKDKTAVAYGMTDKIRIMISEDMGKTWESQTLNVGKLSSCQFIGFRNKNDGWLLMGDFKGMGHQDNYIYQTSDGRKTWKEIGNPNGICNQVVTGVGFSTSNIGFVGFRYTMDSGPTIYRTLDRGKTWTNMKVDLPRDYDNFNKTPLSPVFEGAKGFFPIEVRNDTISGVLFLVSNDYGKNWAYDKTRDHFKNK